MDNKEQENKKQLLNEQELDLVHGGAQATICPICGHRITEPLNVHKQKYHK